LSELWLLTETAEDWFARRGFVLRERREAPVALLGSEEFRGACPASAACLAIELRGDRRAAGTD
jgi:N-acetylglutamate synthase-like GNAT family acetyltransferase